MMPAMNAPRAAIALVALVAVAVPRTALAATPNARSVGAPHSVLPFIADDYARGVAEARARKVPLFIEAWAPW
jgi:hypothetical protein